MVSEEAPEALAADPASAAVREGPGAPTVPTWRWLMNSTKTAMATSMHKSGAKPVSHWPAAQRDVEEEDAADLADLAVQAASEEEALAERDPMGRPARK